jgi:hypothetical protein
LKSIFFFKNTGFTSSTFPIQPDFSQNQPATITLNTVSPWTLKRNGQVGNWATHHVTCWETHHRHQDRWHASPNPIFPKWTHLIS